MTEALDISSETFRTYTYSDGSTFTITAPVALHIINDERGTSHRVVDADGMTHRPTRGWVGISWKPREGASPFIA